MSDTKRYPRKTPYSTDIDWWINAGASALRQRSTMQGFMSTLEHGGYVTGVPETDLYADHTIGWCVGEGGVERFRRLEAIWRQVPEQHHRVLVAYYQRSWLIRQPRGLTVESRIGERVAGVAYLVISDVHRKKMLKACEQSGSKTAGIFDRAKSQAHGAAWDAHDAWQSAERGPEEPVKPWGEQWLEIDAGLKARAADGA